jgi:hypothetical protein
MRRKIMKTVKFKFDLDQKIKVEKLGITGVIAMCAFDKGGPVYLIKTGKESDWYNESLLEDDEGGGS